MFLLEDFLVKHFEVFEERKTAEFYSVFEDRIAQLLGEVEILKERVAGYVGDRTLFRLCIVLEEESLYSLLSKVDYSEEVGKEIFEGLQRILTRFLFLVIFVEEFHYR